ncbi:hypothetical protein CYCD_14480 [Tenuifilaceae bacterium CYCD]|nr:hypothetical protein CYCD_14480 [Tenuifilaceae bacterium CYCD]
MNRTKMLLGIFVLISIIPIEIFSQEKEKFLKDHEGHTTYSYNSEKLLLDYAIKVTPQEEVTIKKKLENFSQHLQSYNSLKNPTGFEVHLIGSIGLEPEFLKWSKFLHYELSVITYPWVNYQGKAIWNCSECGAYFNFLFNRPDKALMGYTIGDVFDKDGMLINTEPIEIGEQNGCKLYSNGIAVISNGKPLWLPVTVMEYIEALLRRSKKQLEKGELDQTLYKIFVDKINEEKSTYTEAELNSPAYEGDKMCGCPYRLEGARAFVKLNKDYFDKTKPSTAIQLIIVEADCIQQMDDGELYYKSEDSSPQNIKMVEMLKEFNYADFKKFLE